MRADPLEMKRFALPRRYGRKRFGARAAVSPTDAHNGSLGLMEDKSFESEKAPRRTSKTEFVSLSPVDAHMVPWYPIPTIKNSFQFRVKRSPNRRS